MNILFVYPDKKNPFFKEEHKNHNILFRFISNINSSINSSQKPLAFSLLASITPKKYFVEIVEGDINSINFNKESDLVGIYCITSTAFIAYDIADEFRRRGITVILGGWHPSALPEEAKQHADAVVIGEADEIWPQLLKDFEKGHLKSFYYPTRPVDPNFIPYPCRELYSKEKVFCIQATRGCPYGCEFCSIGNMKYRNIFRMRRIEDVIHEIKMHSGNYFSFHDNSLTINPKYTKELFGQMKKEGINKKFAAMGNIDILAEDDDLLRIARDAGCISWAIGFESISQETLNSIGKNTNKVEQYTKAIKNIRNHGMWITGWFVFGFDTDKVDVFSKTDEFVKKNDIDLPRPLILTPFPGAPLYERYNMQNRILTKDWGKYDTKHVVFNPKNMTPEELFQNTTKLHKEWYRTSNIIRRTLKSAKFGFVPLINTPKRNYYERIRGPEN